MSKLNTADSEASCPSQAQVGEILSSSLLRRYGATFWTELKIMNGLPNTSKMKSVSLVSSLLKLLAESQDCRLVSPDQWFSTCELQSWGGHVLTPLLQGLPKTIEKHIYTIQNSS